MHNAKFTDEKTYRSAPNDSSKKEKSLFSLCSSLSLVTVKFQCVFIYLQNKQVKPRAWGFNYLFLCTLAMRKRQSDGVLLSKGSKLFEELAKDDGTVDGIFDSQHLSLFLLATGTTSCTAPEQSVVQWLAEG